MRLVYVAFLGLLLSVSAAAQPSQQLRPRLVVGIVVDQMRWDYLYRYFDRYGEGGFKKLLQQGFSCDQTMINYLPSFTAPGHTCIYTGSVPSIHGIAANDWIDNSTGRHWYCTEDTLVSPVGGSWTSGRMSPRNLLSSTITDELRLATNFHSRVYGIALKDRGAILPAGHLANGAYWFDDGTGNLISSSYYGNALPLWLINFNNKRLADTLLRQSWTTLYPLHTYRQSLQDDNPYEGAFKGEAKPIFPHFPNGTSVYGNLRKVPAGNSYTLEAAKACIRGEHLGKTKETDFLCVSLSSTDYIGHQFTPNSIEAEDTYLRLDRELARFIRFLEREVGSGNFLLFLTADHGGAHNADFLTDKNMPAGNKNEVAMSHSLQQHLKNVFGRDSLIRGFENYQVSLNEEKINGAKIGRQKVVEAVKRWFYKQPQVAYVIDLKTNRDRAVPESILTMAVNGYNRLRSGSLLVVYYPGWYNGYSKTGTTHGGWSPYDTHIPLLWYGWGIKSGRSSKPVMMEDIAPTLAALLKIQMPNGCIGKPINDLLK